MKISIYQINPERDKNRIMFMNLKDIISIQGSETINSSLYDKVFDGEVACKDIEEIFEMFNVSKPIGYKGHSLSVSDVIEVKGDSPILVGRIRFYISSSAFEECDYLDENKFKADIEEAMDVGRTIKIEHLEGKNTPRYENGFYLCDKVGFKKVSFSPVNA